MCSEIPGDAAMYSMIRVWSRPVECPLQGPYSLSYGKGGADKQCSHPQPHTIEWKPYWGHIWWEKLLNLAHFPKKECHLLKLFNIEFQLTGMGESLTSMAVFSVILFKLQVYDQTIRAKHANTTTSLLIHGLWAPSLRRIDLVLVLFLEVIE